MTIFILALILVSSILLPGHGGAEQSTYKEIFSHCVLSSFIAWWLWKYNRWLAAFLVWMIVELFFGQYQSRALISFSNILLGCMLYLGIRHLTIDKDKIFKGLCIASFLQSVTPILQLANLFPFWNSAEDSGRVWGLFGNSNFSGCFLAITLPLFIELWRKEKKWFYIVGFMLSCAALVIMRSNTAILSAALGVSFYLYMAYFRRFQKAVLCIILVSLAWVILNPVCFDDHGRFDIWYKTWKLSTFGGEKQWMCKFVQGFGLGSAFQILPKLSAFNAQFFQTHNEYLQVLLEYGLVGVSLVIGIIAGIVRKFRMGSLAVFSCLLALGFESMTFFPFRVSPIGYIGVLYLALIDKEHHGDTLRDG